MNKVKLIDAPIGLFLFHGIMVLKTEYGTVNDGEVSPDCYLVGSGEYFWGGVNTAKERNNLMVTPIKAKPVVHGRWENYPSHIYRRCSVCKVEFDKPRFNVRAKYCPNCGAVMTEKDGADNAADI